MCELAYIYKLLWVHVLIISRVTVSPSNSYPPSIGPPPIPRNLKLPPGLSRDGQIAKPILRLRMHASINPLFNYMVYLSIVIPIFCRLIFLVKPICLDHISSYSCLNHKFYLVLWEKSIELSMKSSNFCWKLLEISIFPWKFLGFPRDFPAMVYPWQVWCRASWSPRRIRQRIRRLRRRRRRCRYSGRRRKPRSTAGS